MGCHGGQAVAPRNARADEHYEGPEQQAVLRLPRLRVQGPKTPAEPPPESRTLKGGSSERGPPEKLSHHSMGRHYLLHEEFESLQHCGGCPSDVSGRQATRFEERHGCGVGCGQLSEF
jgi:hypothetical protein